MEVLDIMQTVVDEVSAEMTPILKQLDSFIQNVRFDYGHPSELVGRLAEMSMSKTARYKKYPIIGLFLDFPEQKGVAINVKSRAKLNMFIAHGTKQDWSSFQRNQNNFVPYLTPILESFIKHLTKSKWILKPDGNLFTYTEVKRFYWGSQGFEFYKNGEKNVFGDYIDAIEIQGLEIDTAVISC
jgi:hypothetical protein